MCSKIFWEKKVFVLKSSSSIRYVHSTLVESFPRFVLRVLLRIHKFTPWARDDLVLWKVNDKQVCIFETPDSYERKWRLPRAKSQLLFISQKTLKMKVFFWIIRKLTLKKMNENNLLFPCPFWNPSSKDSFAVVFRHFQLFFSLISREKSHEICIFLSQKIGRILTYLVSLFRYFFESPCKTLMRADADLSQSQENRGRILVLYGDGSLRLREGAMVKSMSLWMLTEGWTIFLCFVSYILSICYFTRFWGLP